MQRNRLRGLLHPASTSPALHPARALAFDPPLLERTWQDVKALMATPTTLDPLTQEMVYIAVSIANACSYCVHSHTAAALANGLQVPVDAVFDTGRSGTAAA
jgi:AhpD family alkylhydroperoxidase